MKNKKLLLGIIAAVGAVGVIIAVGMGGMILGNPKVSSDEYGVLLKSLSDPFWSSVADGIKDGIEDDEIEIDYNLADLNADEPTKSQLKSCNDVLDRKPRVLITAVNTHHVLLPCLKRATDEGILVIDLDSSLDHNIATDAGVDIVFTLSSNNYVAGVQGADYVLSLLGTSSTGSVLVIEGLVNDINSQRRTSGFADQLKKINPGLKIVTSLSAYGNIQKATKITTDALQKYPDLKVVFAASNKLALGAVEVVYSASKGNDVTVIGVGKYSKAVENSIRANRLNASVVQLPYLIGQQAVLRAVKVLNGKNLNRFQYVDFLVLSKKLLEEGTEPMLEYLK